VKSAIAGSSSGSGEYNRPFDIELNRVKKPVAIPLRHPASVAHPYRFQYMSAGRGKPGKIHTRGKVLSREIILSPADARKRAQKPAV
jgi:hypothetical protein